MIVKRSCSSASLSRYDPAAELTVFLPRMSFTVCEEFSFRQLSCVVSIRSRMDFCRCYDEQDYGQEEESAQLRQP